MDPDAIDPAGGAGNYAQPEHGGHDEARHEGQVFADGLAEAACQDLPRGNVGGRVLGVHGLEVELVLAELAAVLPAVLEPLQEAFLVRVPNAPRAFARTKEDTMAFPAHAALLFVVLLHPASIGRESVERGNEHTQGTDTPIKSPLTMLTTSIHRLSCTHLVLQSVPHARSFELAEACVLTEGGARNPFRWTTLAS